MRAVGYGRVSTLAQALKGTSPEEQQRKIEEECQRNNYQLVNIYTDDGFSGKSIENRPGLQKLITDAKSGKFNCVMFTRLDRLGRNLRDLLNIWELLTENLRLDLICIDEPAVNTNKGRLGKVMLHILGTFAEFERDIIGERTKSGRRKVWSDNTSVIGALPYGYMLADHTRRIIPNPDTTPIVRKIYSLYLDHRLSMKDIANHLSKMAIPTPSSVRDMNRKSIRWNNVTVNNILKNSAYTGCATYNQYVFKTKKGRNYMQPSKEKKDPTEWIDVKFTPIIPEQRFDEAQKLIKAKVHNPKKKFEEHKNHFLLENNLLFCGECGSRMKKARIQKHPPNNGFYFYYTCYWHSASEKELIMTNRKRCSMKIGETEVDSFVLRNISRFLADPRKFSREWLRDINLEEVKERVVRLTKNKEETNQGIKRILEQYYKTSNPDVKKVTDEMIKKYTTELEEITSQLDHANEEHDMHIYKSQKLEEFDKYIKMLTASDKPNLDLRFRFRMRVMKFIEALDFDAKKKLIEAIISPENGGKCIVRYKKVKNAKPDKSIEIKFNADLNKILALISGIDRNNLLNKFDYGRITPGSGTGSVLSGKVSGECFHTPTRISF